MCTPRRNPVRSLLVCFLLISVVALSAFAAESDPAPAKAGGPDFKKEVLPILEAKCLDCHGAKKKDGKLDLRTRDAMLKGGNTGAAIEPGKPDKSLLIELIHFNEMPPKKTKPRVTADEMKLLKAWIEAGAPEK
jgi:hypothetical protein